MIERNRFAEGERTGVDAHGRESGLDEAGVRGLTDRASPAQPVRGRSRTVVSFTQVVDRAQLGDAYRGKVEAEMVRIVHRVHKVLVRRTVGLV